MSDKQEKPIQVRVLNAVVSLALLASVVYILVAGIDLASSLILLAAIGGLAGPIVVSGAGVVEAVVGMFEAFVEGVLEILSAIADLLSSIFG